jgi:hypothetical protein
MLLAARPSLEAVSIGGAIQKENAGAWKADCVAPHASEPGMSLGNEILEVAFPAATVVRVEQELATRQHDPAREMDGAD